MYKWVTANCWSNLTEHWVVTCNEQASHQGRGGGGSAIPSQFVLQKPELNTENYDPVGLKKFNSFFYVFSTSLQGGAVASWLVRSSPDRAVWVRALAGDIVLCSWARHFTPTVSLSTQVYKWVPANLMLGVTLRWTSIPSRGE